MADTTAKEATDSKEQGQQQQQQQQQQQPKSSPTPTPTTTPTAPTPATDAPSGSAGAVTSAGTKPSSSQPPTPTNSTAPEAPRITKQKYEEAKLELQMLLGRKKQVDTNLIDLENAIYKFEGSYLEDTQQNGNIIRGFEGFLQSRPERRKSKPDELDRLFSLSSSTYQKALTQKEERDESSQDDRSTSSILSARRDKKRKLKSLGSGDIRKKRWHGSAGRDSDEDGDM